MDTQFLNYLHKFPSERKMFQLRSEQLDSIIAGRRKNYEDRLIEHVQEAFPEEVWDLPKDLLRHRIRKSIDCALTFGLESEEDIASFVDLTFELGEDFHTQPSYDWTRRILLDPQLEGRSKISKITGELNELEDGIDFGQEVNEPHKDLNALLMDDALDDLDGDFEDDAETNNERH